MMQYHYGVVASSWLIAGGCIVTTYYLLLQIVIQSKLMSLHTVVIASGYQVLVMGKGTISKKNGRFQKVSDEDKENSIWNHPVQGAGADAVKTPLVDFDRELSDKDARIYHILHECDHC